MLLWHLMDETVVHNLKIEKNFFVVRSFICLFGRMQGDSITKYLMNHVLMVFKEHLETVACCESNEIKY